MDMQSVPLTTQPRAAQRQTETDMPAGSMGPKAQAACPFVRQTGKPAFISSLNAAKAVMSGEAGTRVIP